MHLDFLESAEFYNRRYHNFSHVTSGSVYVWICNVCRKGN